MISVHFTIDGWYLVFAIVLAFFWGVSLVVDGVILTRKHYWESRLAKTEHDGAAINRALTEAKFVSRLLDELLARLRRREEEQS